MAGDERRGQRAAVAGGVALLAVLAVAVVVRLPYLGFDGFWYDEHLTAEFMTGRGDLARSIPIGVRVSPVPDSTSLEGAPWPGAIWTTLEATVHPPLYYMAVRLWAEVFGDGDVAMRSWSLVCGVAGVAVLWDLVRRHQSVVAAGFAAAAMALAGPQIYFSHEARHYSQATLLLLLAAWAAWPAGERPTLSWRRAGGIGLALLGAMLTHYFAAGVALAIVVAAWLNLAPPGRRRLAAAVAGAAAVWLVAWGPQFARQLGDGFATTSWIGHNPRPVADALYHLGKLPLGMFIYSDPVPAWVRAASWSLWLVPLARAVGTRSAAVRRGLLPWVLWFGLGILPAAALEIVGGREIMEYPRYTVFAAPGLFALAAATFADWPRPWVRWLVPSGAVLMGAVELTRPYTRPLPDYRPIGEFMAQHLEPGDDLILIEFPELEWLHRGVYRSLSRYGFDAGELRSITVLQPDADWQLPAEVRRAWVFFPMRESSWRPTGLTRQRDEPFAPIGTLALWERPAGSSGPSGPPGETGVRR